MKTSEHSVELLTALAKADLANPAKSSTAQIPTKKGGSFSYSYAALEDIITEVKPRLANVGLVFLQDAATIEGRTTVTTRLADTKTGQWIEAGPLAMPAANDAQSVGSAITYARRYQLLAVLGLATEDDDGARAQRTAAGGGAAATSSSPAAPPSGAGLASGQGTGVPAPDTSSEGGSTGEAEAAGKGASPAEGLPSDSTAPTFDELVVLAGSVAGARAAINDASGASYTAGSVRKATALERAAAREHLAKAGL